VDGRRVADRRAVQMPVAAPEGLPRNVRHSTRVRFVEPLEIPEDFQRDVEAVRAIVRFQSGASDFSELYDRWLEPVWTYLSVTLDRGADVEAHTSTALAEAYRALPEATPGPTQVRTWLFGLAYRAARPRGLENTRPLAAPTPPVPVAVDAVDEDVLRWLSDEDLLLLVERRPPAERHVLVLRYFAGLSFVEIGSIMGIEPSGAVALHRAAVSSLDATLAGVGRSGRAEERHPMGRLTHQTPTLRQRRRALLAA
jgi:DNA-directed RNA polymerase specialized sigma24 family protein